MKADQILLRVMDNLCELAKLAEEKLSFRKTADFSDALEAFPTWADRVARSQFFGKWEQDLSHNLDYLAEKIRQETHVSCWHQLA